MLAQAIDTRLRPVQAFRAVRRLLRNPDDTAQVFVILRAMRGASAARAFRRFQGSDVGGRVLAEKRELLDALSDSARLSALPPDSLGAIYHAFMRRENLSARGLMQSAEDAGDDGWPPEALLFRDRMRVMHDLTHVVTGYGRDPFGELCLMAFSHAQSGHAGMGMIVGMGALRLLREKQRGATLAALLEARRHGRAASWLAGEDWEAMLELPLDEVRRRFNIAPPARYKALAQ